MKDVAKVVKRKINESVDTDDYITDQYLDEDNNIKIEFTIKSISDEESMFYYSAFIYASLEAIGSVFIRTMFLNDNKKKWKDWEQELNDEEEDKMDDITFKLFDKCFNDATNGQTLANKLKEEAPNMGFEFDFKVIEEK